MESHEEFLELRSEEVQELISQPPGWINRWGITFIFFLLALLLTLSWFIQYPDVIKAKIVIITSPPPITLLARTSGSMQLLMPEHASIRRGDIIAFLESPAVLSDVLALEKAIGAPAVADQYLSGDHWTLGELEPAFVGLVNAQTAFSNFQRLDIHDRQIQQFRQQIGFYQKLNGTQQTQLALAREVLLVAHERFRRDSILHTQKVISDEAYNTAQATYLQQRQGYKVIEAGLYTNEIEVNELTKQITTLDAEREETYARLLDACENEKRKLIASILKWKETYVFTAPCDGTLAYLKFIENNIFAAVGEAFFTVIPKTDDLYAQAEIPVTGYGKVKMGQAVNIRLDSYPHEQFGMLTGTISDLSDFPTDGRYLARISLNSGLLTSYHKTLPLRQQLQGETEIITEDLRVLERIFYQLRKLATGN
jgi:multidrug resistance efflux pump